MVCHNLNNLSRRKREQEMFPCPSKQEGRRSMGRWNANACQQRGPPTRTACPKSVWGVRSQSQAHTYYIYVRARLQAPTPVTTRINNNVIKTGAGETCRPGVAVIRNRGVELSQYWPSRQSGCILYPLYISQVTCLHLVDCHRHVMSVVTRILLWSTKFERSYWFKILSIFGLTLEVNINESHTQQLSIICPVNQTESALVNSLN